MEFQPFTMISVTSESRTNGSSGPSPRTLSPICRPTRSLSCGEAGLVLVQQLAKALLDETLELGVGERSVVELRPERLHQAALDPVADLRDPVLRHRLCWLGQSFCDRHVVVLLPLEETPFPLGRGQGVITLLARGFGDIT